MEIDGGVGEAYPFIYSSSPPAGCDEVVAAVSVGIPALEVIPDAGFLPDRLGS